MRGRQGNRSGFSCARSEIIPDFENFFTILFDRETIIKNTSASAPVPLRTILCKNPVSQWKIRNTTILDNAVSVAYSAGTNPTTAKGRNRRFLLTGFSYFERFEALETPETVDDFGNDVIRSIDLLAQGPDDLITKAALCRLFECSERTLRRMVARRDLPPPLIVAGKNVWPAGMLGKWLADAARMKQAEIEAEARRLRAIMAERWRN